jgi:hypothetical protein
MARLKDRWKALELNIIMVSTISWCVFSAFGNPRSCDHLVIATQTSMVLNTKGIFRMKFLYDLVTRYFFSVRTPFFRNQREWSESTNCYWNHNLAVTANLWFQ